MFICIAFVASLEKALAGSVVFGVFLSIIQTKWNRRDRRFWIVIAVLAVIHIALLALIHIPKLQFGLIVLPFALVDGFAIWWLINWVERKFPGTENGAVNEQE